MFRIEKLEAEFEQQIAGQDAELQEVKAALQNAKEVQGYLLSAQCFLSALHILDWVPS